MVDPLPMLTLFEKQIHLRRGQANVRYWTDDIMPLLTDAADPLGVEDLATHKLPLNEAPHGYEIFQKKQDGAIKIVCASALIPPAQLAMTICLYVIRKFVA